MVKMGRFKKGLVSTKYNSRFWLDIAGGKEDRINISSSSDGWVMVTPPKWRISTKFLVLGEKMDSFWSIVCLRNFQLEMGEMSELETHQLIHHLGRVAGTLEMLALLCCL